MVNNVFIFPYFDNTNTNSAIWLVRQSPDVCFYRRAGVIVSPYMFGRSSLWPSVRVSFPGQISGVENPSADFFILHTHIP